MGTDEEKSKQRFALSRQHVAEWNAQLASEVGARIALDNKHTQEHKQAYLNEIDVRDRVLLATSQLDAIHKLVRQNRAARIMMRQRHQRENEALNQKLV